MNVLKIVGDDFRHCLYSNNPLPPTSFYDEIQWNWNVDERVDNVVFYTNGALEQGARSPVKTKIAWLIEPYEFIPHAYEFVKQNNASFTYVFTHEKSLLDLGQNYKFIPFGGCWIDETDRNIHSKTKFVSITASNKTQLSGHHLRHQVIRQFGTKLDVYGNGYNPVAKKITTLQDYMFSVVIENCKRDYWFTEKLIDCLVTGTIPIYWGCPSIGDFFDIRGFIVWEDISELDDIINGLTVEKYMSMLPYVMKNFELAKNYVLAENFIDKLYIQTGALL